MATGGLLLKRASNTASTNVMPDGGEAKDNVSRGRLRWTLGLADGDHDDSGAERPGDRDEGAWHVTRALSLSRWE